MFGKIGSTCICSEIVLAAGESCSRRNWHRCSTSHLIGLLGVQLLQLVFGAIQVAERVHVDAARAVFSEEKWACAPGTTDFLAHFFV